MSLEAGQVFAGYVVVRRLGAGGMGEVYLAQHPRLPRQDAIKVLPPHLAADEAFRARFLREADVAAGLSHPHIVGVLDRGEDEGRLWLSMPYIAGVDAAARLAQSPAGLPFDEVAAIVRDTAAALDFAHQRGVLHRDVKPANILLDGGRALLSDFGIARATGDSSDLTATGMTIGSVAYSSPEQLRGDPIDARADVYSLAATAHTLLTGARPFERSSPAAVIAAALDGSASPVSATRPDLSGAVDAAVARGMARDREYRPRTAGEFAAALTAAGPAPRRDARVTTVVAVPPYAPPQLSPATIPPARPMPPARTTPSPAAPAAAHRRWLLPLAVVAVMLAGAAVTGTVVALNRGGSDPTAAPAATTTAETAARTAVPNPGPAPTVTTTTTAAPTTTVITTTAPFRGPADLALSRPISIPACDGRYILVLGSYEESNAALKSLVGADLAANPDAGYFSSAFLDCGSIRTVDDSGQRFYTPYVDYGTDRAGACASVARRGAYVRVLSNAVAPGVDPCVTPG